MSTTVLQAEGFEVVRVDPRIFVLRISSNVSRRVVAQSLDAIWQQPDWSQPWGLVVTIGPSATYDRDILRHEVPPEHRRAVGTAIACTSVFHRMIVNSIGIGLRLARFQLTGHSTEDEAIEKMSERVLETQARNRLY